MIVIWYASVYADTAHGLKVHSPGRSSYPIQLACKINLAINSVAYQRPAVWPVSLWQLYTVNANDGDRASTCSPVRNHILEIIRPHNG